MRRTRIDRSRLPFALEPTAERGRWKAVFWATVVVVLCCRCTPEEKRKALGFFFDGVVGEERPVPAPSAQTEEDADARPVAAKPVVPMFKHKPFEEGQCESCHGAHGQG